MLSDELTQNTKEKLEEFSFLKNLSYSLLHFCKNQGISQRTFSLQCDLSDRCIGDICCRRKLVKLDSLEKICKATHLTPNDLLLFSEEDAPAYRFPMEITVVRLYRNRGGATRPVCPRCFVTLEKKYLPTCTRCGQALAWNQLHNATILESD